MEKVNVALIGCGGMGASLIRAAKGVELAAVTCVADPQVERARKLAEELGCDYCADSEDVISRDDVDAVFVAAPNFLHAPMTIRAAQAGKHVFCEKPMALSTQDARQMVEAAERAGVKLMVGQVLRYIAPYVYMWDLVRSGELGEPFCMQTTRIGGSWKDTPYAGGWREQARLVGLLHRRGHRLRGYRLRVNGV